MKAKNLLFIIVIASSSIAAQAQTADEIISKNIDAVGGEELLAKINTMYAEGAVSALGSDYTTKVYCILDKTLKSETTVNGTSIIQWITDTGGWSLNPLTGQTEPAPMTAEQWKAARPSLDFRGPLYHYKDKGYTATLLERDGTKEASPYRIKLTNNEGSEFTYDIDPTTFYVLKLGTKATVGGKDILNSISYSDYKKTAFGYVMPRTTSTTNLGYDVVIKYTTIEINKEIDPKIFVMPK